MPSKEELQRIVTPPAERWPVLSADEIQRSYGTALPEDYLWLMEMYGPGEFAGDLSIWPPVTASEVGKIAGIHYPQPGALQMDENVDPAYLVPGALLMWGLTMNDECAFWHVVGAPDDWAIVVGRDFGYSPTMSRYECGIVDFLVRTFRGQGLQRNPFGAPDLWRNDSPTFTRH